MKRPKFPIDRPERALQAREFLGLDKIQMATALRLSGRHGRAAVRRYEVEKIPGPVQLAYERLIEAHVNGEG